jgi:hypothetical protein
LAVAETGTVVEDNKVEWRCLGVIQHNVFMYNTSKQVKRKENEQDKDRERVRKQQVMAYRGTRHGPWWGGSVKGICRRHDLGGAYKT